MGNFDWIIAGFSVFVGIASAACTVILPVLMLAGIGYFLYKRNQQSMAYRQTTQAWLSTTGTVLMSSVQSRTSGRSHSTYPVVVYQYAVNGKNHQSRRAVLECASFWSGTSNRCAISHWRKCNGLLQPRKSR